MTHASPSPSLRGDAAQVVRGFLMGGADIIPGVSGGTVALILGIYERLVTAISHFDTTFVGHLRHGRIASAARHVDLRFVVTLLIGIGIGVVGLASTMHWLLEHELQRTMAAFFGMILASSLLVGRMVAAWGVVQVLGLVAGATFAFWIVGLPFLEDSPDTALWVAFAGAVAICAMILPGISGAFILLILGEYHHVTGILKGLPRGEIDGTGIRTLAAFAAGALVGILSFSKLLRFLLAHFHATTLAVLAGFMLGSLRKIWPFQVDTTPDVEKFKLKVFENRAPDLGATETWITIGIAIAGLAFVLLLERIATPPAAPTPPPAPKERS